MAESQCIAKPCRDCGRLFNQQEGLRGRPRIRCVECSPLQIGLSRQATEASRRRHQCEAKGCGRWFTSVDARVQHFCSDQCRIRTNNLRQQAARRDRSARSCRGCGASFTPAYGDLRKAFCSGRCRTADTYRRRTGSSHRRRARRFGCTYEEVDKNRVFQRDGWRCVVCGIATPAELRGTTEPNAPELDHEVPLSRGGAHSYANTRCLCKRCNQAKGARLDAELSPS